MEKAISKIFIPVFSLIFLFSSCLGDNENVVEITRNFSFVTKDQSGIQYAATSAGYPITSDAIKNVTPGHCYYVSFKISSNSSITNGVYNAETSGMPELIKSSEFSLSAPPVVPPTGTDSLYVSSFNVGNRMATEYFGDRWEFGYTWQQRGDETAKAFFYYDKDNQYDSDGTQIKTSGSDKQNRAVIDVYLTKNNLGSSGASQSKPEVTVTDLTKFRQTFVPNATVENDIVSDGNTKYVTVAIKFRYWSVNTSTGVKERKYIGTWSISASNAANSYYMLIKI